MRYTGSSGLFGSARSPPNITWGSTLNAQSATTSQSRVWVMVWTDWGISAPAIGHDRMGPSPSQRTIESWPK